jgi:hypothetical protein
MPTGATTTPFLLRAANTTVFIHSVLANKLSLALKVTGKVLKKKILTIRHIAGNVMTSIETENTSNKIPRQYLYQ